VSIKVKIGVATAVKAALAILAGTAWQPGLTGDAHDLAQRPYRPAQPRQHGQPGRAHRAGDVPRLPGTFILCPFIHLISGPGVPRGTYTRT